MLKIEKIKKLIKEIQEQNYTAEIFDEEKMYGAYTSGYFDGREKITVHSSHEEWPHLREMYKAGYKDGVEDRQRTLSTTPRLKP